MTDIPATPPNARRGARYYFIGGLLLFGALLIAFGWRAVADALVSARPAPLAGMLALIVAGYLLRALKWRYALGPGVNAVSLFFLAKMAGNWSPGRVGELAPLLLPEHRSARVGTWIAADRVLEILLTLAFGAAGAASLGWLSWPPQAVLAAVIVGIALFTYWWRLLPNAGAGRPESKEFLPWRNNALVQRVLRIGTAIGPELRALRAKTIPILLLTVAAKITDIYTVMLLCAAFGYEASFLLVCAARCAHALVSAVPVTPDATGVPYVAQAWLLHEYAAMPYPVLTAALAVEAAAIHGVLWCFFAMTGPRLRRPPRD